MEFIPLLAILLGLIWFMFMLPADMAATRNRSQIGWIFLNLLFPFWALVLLWILGDKAPEVEYQETGAYRNWLESNEKT